MCKILYKIPYNEIHTPAGAERDIKTRFARNYFDGSDPCGYNILRIPRRSENEQNRYRDIISERADKIERQKSPDGSRVAAAGAEKTGKMVKKAAGHVFCKRKYIVSEKKQ